MATNNRASLYWTPETKERLRIAVAESDIFTSVSAMSQWIINQHLDSINIPRQQPKRALL